MATWWRVREADGHVVGVSRMARERAEVNLGPGQVLVEAPEGVDPRCHKLVGGLWVSRDPEPALKHDYAFMRASGYDIGAQVGALMKVVAVIAATPAVVAVLPAETKAEFDALVARIAALKARHPKP